MEETIKIVSILKPFEYNQNIYVVENGDTLAVEHCTIAEMPEVLYNLCQKYNTQQIDIAGGSKEYAKHIGDDISKYATTKYSSNDLIINYI